MEGCTYVEPFAGGAGLALRLLFQDIVSEVIINDIDPSIYSFWHCVLNRTDEICDLVLNTPVSVEEWNIQKEIWQNNGNGDLLTFGFSTLFLNRTNISGILKGGMIGGYDQTGLYKINARYNKQIIINKIRKISEYRDRIRVYNLDVIDLIEGILPLFQNSFVYFDPPYVKKGSSLYVNFYTSKDHIRLAEIINHYNGAWMVTYDDCPLIRNLYKDRRQYIIPINYSAGATKRTHEISIFCDEIQLMDNNNPIQLNSR